MILKAEHCVQLPADPGELMFSSELKFRPGDVCVCVETVCMGCV